MVWRDARDRASGATTGLDRAPRAIQAPGNAQQQEAGLPGFTASIDAEAT